MDSTATQRRRRPKYPRFLASGALVGLLVGLGLSVGLARSEVYSAADGFFYVCAIAIPVGALLGGLVAILAESRSLKDPGS